MTRKQAGAVAIGAAAIGILTATAVPALGHGPRAVSPTAACPVVGEGMGSMMGIMGSRASVGMTGRDAMGGMMDPRSMGPMGSMMGMMGPGSMHSMMGLMGSDALDGASAPVGEDTTVDPVDHAAHHPAAIPEPTE